MPELRKILNEKLFDGRTGMLAVDQGLERADAKVAIPMPEGIIRCDRLDPKVSAILPSAQEIVEFTNSTDDPQRIGQKNLTGEH